MILTALLAAQTALPPPPRLDFDRLRNMPPLIMDASTTSCAMWTERQRGDQTARIADMAWLTGIADAEQARERGRPKISFALILGSMDNACGQNPNRRVLDTAEAVLVNLRSEHR